MENRRDKRNIFNRMVAFTVSGVAYRGTIDNISSRGVHVIVDEPVSIEEGDDISITIAYADSEQDVKTARVVWADASGFGAKFEK